MSKRPSFLLAAIPAVLLLGGCGFSSDNEVVMTQVEIRELQTRSYDIADQKKVMKVMIDVLQDDGYVVKNANLDLGVITASKDVDVEKAGQKFWAKFSDGYYARWDKNCEHEVSATVSEFGPGIKIRMNIQNKIYDNQGGIASAVRILDGGTYQEIFTKVSKGLFLEAVLDSKDV